MVWLCSEYEMISLQNDWEAFAFSNQFFLSGCVFPRFTLSDFCCLNLFSTTSKSTFLSEFHWLSPFQTYTSPILMYFTLYYMYKVGAFHDTCYMYSEFPQLPSAEFAQSQRRCISNQKYHIWQVHLELQRTSKISQEFVALYEMFFHG